MNTDVIQLFPDQTFRHKKFGMISVVLIHKTDPDVGALTNWPEHRPHARWMCKIFVQFISNSRHVEKCLGVAYEASPKAARNSAVNRAREELIDNALVLDAVETATRLVRKQLQKFERKKEKEPDNLHISALFSYYQDELKHLLGRQDNVVEIQNG